MFVWEREDWPERSVFAVGTALSAAIPFWTAIAALWIIDRSGVFDSRKIQPGKRPRPGLERRAAIKLAVGHLFIQPVLLYAIYPAFAWFGMEMSAATLPSWTEISMVKPYPSRLMLCPK